MIFRFTNRDHQWRRILDSLARTSDAGFYIDPSNLLDVFPVMNAGPVYGLGTYVNVALTVSSSNIVDAYMNGTLEFSTTTTVMDISADALLGFFLDNSVDGGIGEWSPGDIAAARIYSGVLTQDQVNALNNVTTPAEPTNSPEPATLALLASGAAGAVLLRRRQEPVTA